MQISVETPPPSSATPADTAASRTTTCATPGTSGSVGDSHLNDEKWEVKYGFWNDLDVLYSEFPPPKKPRIPSQQLDGAQEWEAKELRTAHLLVVVQRSVKVHLHQLKPMQVRTKLLHICSQEKIGFTRDGLEELLERCDSKLLPSVEKLRLVFLAQFFLSLPNVQKRIEAQETNNNQQKAATTKPNKSKSRSRNGLRHKKPEVPPFPLSVLEMSEPLRRCKKCTLLPPCSHISLEMLFDKVQHIRNLYPHQDDDDDDEIGDTETGSTPQPPLPEMCPSFLNAGVCSNIRSLGRCQYAHPLTLHEIDTSQIGKRCKVHTLPLLCTHCANASASKEELRTEIRLCMQLEAQMRARRKQCSDLEMSKLLFVRDRAKSVK